MTTREFSNGILRTLFILFGISAVLYLVYALFSLVIYIV